MRLDEDETHGYLIALRDGSPAEKIEARLGLARICEQRGMIAEAAELLESNIDAGLTTPAIFRWLARLYKIQGRLQFSGKMIQMARSLDEQNSLATVVHPQPTVAPRPPTPTPRRDEQQNPFASRSAPSRRDRTRILCWVIGGVVFISLIIGIELLDQRPDQMNPMRSLWYVFTLANDGYGLQIVLEFALPAIAAWVVGPLIGRRITGPDGRNVRKWIALVCAWSVGLFIYSVLFAIGEALLDASFRARLPIVVWIVYWIFVGAYRLNVGLGLLVHILISGLFGLGVGAWLYEKTAQ